MKEIRTWLNFNYDDPDNFEHVSGVSMTLPDQSLTINQIIDRFTRGQSSESKQVQFDVNSEVSDNDALDVYDTPDEPDDLIRQQELEESIKRSQDERRELESSVNASGGAAEGVVENDKG